MGAASRRPPLPAPTDISSAVDEPSVAAGGTVAETSDDLDTDLSRHTDRTHYSIPEDGSPVTITTGKKHRKVKEDSKSESQTSLIIEYYEGQARGPSTRPSLRVRVQPSTSRKKKDGVRDHIEISESKGGRPSNIRRISIPTRGGTDKESYSSLSEISSGEPPVEVDIMHNESEISSDRYMAAPSDVSAMPASVLEGPTAAVVGARMLPGKETITRDTLKEPERRDSRSASRERLVQRVKEKVQADHKFRIKDSKDSKRKSEGRSRSGSKEYVLEDAKTGKSRSKYREESRSEVSLISSTGSTASINNPKFLQAVSDAIKTLIPEFETVRQEQELTVPKTRSRGEGREIRERRPSKSSSISSVRGLDERGNHEGTRRRSRRTSRESVSDRSRETSVRDEREKKRISSKEKLAIAAVTGVVAGAGAAALKHHHSSREGKRRHSKGERRSSASSLSEHREHVDHVHDETPTPTKHSRHMDIDESTHSKGYSIPDMPMQSMMESDLTRGTRDSIVSADTERPLDTSRTPVPVIREVSRGATHQAMSPLASPHLERGRVASHEHVGDFADDRSTSTTQPHFGAGAGAAVGFATAAAAAAYALGHHSHDGPKTPTRDSSPVQSDNSYFYEREDYPQHRRVRSIRSNESASSERRRNRKTSPISGSPTLQLARDRKREGISLESPYEILHDDEYQPETPNPDDVDAWFAKEHEQNEQYRKEIDRESRLGPLVEGKRDTISTDDSLVPSENIQHNLRTVGANPEYVHTPLAVESAVASLQDPSTISVRSSESSIRDRGLVSQPESVTLVQGGGIPPHFRESKARWEQIRDHAMALTHRNSLDQMAYDSPAQSPTRSIGEEPIMHSSYVPQPGDMPEIGVGLDDDESELLTNPSIISGRIGEGIEMPSYEPSPNVGREAPSHMREVALVGAGVGLGLAASNMVKHQQPTVEDEKLEEPILQRELLQDTPIDLQAQDNLPPPPISKDLYPGENNSPLPNPIPAVEIEENFDEEDDDDDDDDVFTSQKHFRHESGLSHGMASPLYDAATGKGLDRIQSKDVVALMDHLAMRDAARSARDTEILVTLVRSAAEMRNNFEEMKRKIEDRDRMIINNMERTHEKTVQRVLSGPRPFPGSGPQTPKAVSTEAIDAPTKRANLFKRALRGLSARNSNDLVRIEQMLVQLLGEVEGLKDSQGPGNHPLTQTTSLNSYEHLRAAPETIYEPEGRTATNSGSPGALSAGYLSTSSRHMSNGMRSGYDGLRSSEGHNRISTVLEGDEDFDESAVLGTAQAVQPVYQSANIIGTKGINVETPPEQSAQFQSSNEQTPRTEKTKSKYKSGASSIFSAIPKMSRWSKTTSSTVPDSGVFASGGSKKNERPASFQSMSQDSMTGSNPDEYEYEYDVNEDDRLHSAGSLVGDQRGLGKGPGSPLIPHEDDEDYDDYDEYGFDDPKYQAHRNSLNLEHPQPKHGPTHRHKSHLEKQAMVYNVENPPTPEADHWGSAPALALNRGRHTGGARHQLQNEQRVSPVQSDDGEEEYQQHNQQQGYAGMYTMPPALMSSGMHIGSPLEPIEEVRNSLETDRHSILRDEDVTPEPVRPTVVGGHLHPGTNSRGQRKPSGPREMPRSSSGSARRPEGSPVSYDSQLTGSMDSEMF